MNATSVGARAQVRPPPDATPPPGGPGERGAKLPGATQVTDDDGNLVFTVVPEGADPREDMGVLIEADGKYRVFEHARRKTPGS